MMAHASEVFAGNAANQNATAGYNAATDPAAGYGLWPTSMTDANGGVTTCTYEALGRQTSMRAPGQSTAPATQSMMYTIWCSGTSAQSPCVEVDTTQRVTSTTAVTTPATYRQFWVSGLSRRTSYSYPLLRVVSR